MTEQIIEAIEHKNYHILSQYLSKVPFFRESQSILEWAEYQQLLNRIKYVKLQQSRMYQIKPRIFYVMLGNGYTTSKKNRSFISQAHHQHQKFQNILLKGRKQTKIMPNDFKEVNNLENFDLYSFFHGYCVPKFIFTKNNNSYLLKLQTSKMQESTFNILRQNHQEKLRFLLSFQIFQSIERLKLQQQLGCFQVNVFTFGEVIYDHIYNSSKIFFLQTGQVIVSFSGNISSCLNRAPKLLGLDKKLINEKVKCATAQCKIITIQKDQLSRILRQNETRENKQNENQDQDYFKIHSMQSRETNLSYRPLKTADSIHCGQQNLFRTKSISKLQPEKIQKLKCFFSNSLNDNFNKFSQKRLQLINKTRQMEQNQVFYKIKCLVPHLPVMNDINKKLKEVRQAKYKKIKQHIMKTKDQSVLAKRQYLETNQTERQKINQYVNKFIKKKKKQQKQYGVIRKNSILKYDSL